MGCEGQTTSRLKRTTATSQRLVNDSMHFIPLLPVIIEAFVVAESHSRPMRIWRCVMTPFACLRFANDRNYCFAAATHPAQRAFPLDATNLTLSWHQSQISKDSNNAYLRIYIFLYHNC